MIERMKFINMTGPVSEFDRVVDQYLTRFDIHLENALTELKTVEDIGPFNEADPYKDSLARCEKLLHFCYPDLTTHEMRKAIKASPCSIENPSAYLEEVKSFLFSLENELDALCAEQDNLITHIDEARDKQQLLSPFIQLPIAMSELADLSYVKYRLGRIPTESYGKFEKYVYDNLSSIFVPCRQDKQYVWGLYFVAATEADKVDAVYSSMHFERLRLPMEDTDKPSGVCEALEKRIKEDEDALSRIKEKIKLMLSDKKDRLEAIWLALSSLSESFEVRRLAACTREGDSSFFILCGWIPANQADDLAKALELDKPVYAVIEEDTDQTLATPPSRLKNPKIFSPFEMFTSMYGLPAYHEKDPTIFLAITYSFIFGWMFGDLGQGLLLFLAGLILYQKTRVPLWGIICSCGLFSAIFGVLFGSVFGYEQFLPALWLRPMKAMSTLPFIGRLNTVLIVSVAFGAGLLAVTMLLNLANDRKVSDARDFCFGANGLSGLVFYLSIMVVLVLFIRGLPLPGTIVLVVMFVLPLLCIFLKEPLGRLFFHQEPEEKTSAVMFFMQGFFELFETLLSYFSNTLSFVRIGAFAVSHVAMMEVVMMLAKAENGSLGNPVAIVLGNAFVIVMEGLIVGIQVLRLEYYEFFSRFYRGSGRPFISYRSTRKH